MKILVCGGRDYFDAERIDRVLDLIGPSLVIHGDARGFDGLVANWAAKRGAPHECFKSYDETPGSIYRMLNASAIVVAFPGASGFTVGQAMQRGVPVVELT